MGKEKSPTQLPRNVDLNGMQEVNVQGESHGAWKRFQRVHDSASAACGFPSYLLEAKRAGNWSDFDLAGVYVQKKGREVVSMEGIEVVGDSAEAVHQPRRTQ